MPFRKPSPFTALLTGFVMLPVLVASSFAVFAEPPAGVVGYACHDHRALVLLAYDGAKNRKGWAAFGGHGEKDERIADTAAREFREETRCAFEAPLADQLQGQPRSVIGPFYSYVWQVPFVDAEQIEKSRCGTPGERNQFIWVSAADLAHAVRITGQIKAVQAAKDKNPDRNYPLWFAGRIALQQAMQDGLLPVDDSVCQ
ncbi:NUDIX hydrolase [Oceanobacter kriegii]|uniref:NUDIX hydrolase n=1 Tax=Oceanobacter kriegii TaxID=64972 RepID=UPI00041D3C64|nr:NUDIX hydrolase [Oceanobacter kriegii]